MDTCQSNARKQERRALAAEPSTCVFFVSGIPIEKVTEFKYRGRMITENDTDSLAMERNLKRAKQEWGRLRRMLMRRKGAGQPTTSDEQILQGNRSLRAIIRV